MEHLTFLSSGSLVFSVPLELFLTKKIQGQKNMLKLFLRKEQCIQRDTLFLQEMLINIKTHHFHNSINHQEHLFHRALIISYLRPVNIAKFLRTTFLQNTSRSNRLQMFFKIGALKSFTNFTGKHLCWRLFLKNLHAEGLQL